MLVYYWAALVQTNATVLSTSIMSSNDDIKI